MPKFLIEVTYSPEGVSGIRQKGATARQHAAEELIKSVGGTLEMFYFAFGAADVYAIADLPDNESAAAAALAVSSSGLARVRTVPLLTVDQIESAVSRQVTYTPPGS